MTAPSSCKKSFFKEYLLRRIGGLKGYFVISCILSLFALTILVYEIIGTADNIVKIFMLDYSYSPASTADQYLWLLQEISVPALMIMAIIGAPVAFGIYNRPSKTDMLGALPVTHRERFWGDFLGGWIANVAPIIPAGVITVLISIIPQNMLNAADIENGFKASSTCVLFFVGVTLSLLVACTVCYIMSTVAAVCCGKLVKSMLMSLISVGSLVLLAVGISVCFLTVITGSGIWGVDTMYAWIFPAFRVEWDIYGCIVYLSAVDLSTISFGEMFMPAGYYSVFDPLYMLYTAAFSAGLTALAFFLSKSRKLEHTGNLFAYKAYFRVISVIAVAGAFLLTLGLSELYAAPEWSFALSLGLSVFAGVLITILMEIIRLPKARELPKTLIAFALTAACCTGVYVLLDKTGAFGQRFLSAEGVERVEVSYSLHNRSDITITDKNDIETLTGFVNDTLKEHYGDLNSGYEYMLTYVNSDGSEEARGLCSKYNRNRDLIKRLVADTQALPTFRDALADAIDDCIPVEATAWLDGVYGKIVVPDDSFDEFMSLLSEEVREKYSSDAVMTGKLSIYGKRSLQFGIPDSFTRTKEYLMSFAEVSDDDLVMTVSGGDLPLAVNIFRRDLEKDEVKELISLLVRLDDYEAPDYSFNFRADMTDSTSYYVPKSAEQRVAEIIFTLAEQAAE